jgi:hypothetical protein
MLEKFKQLAEKLDPTAVLGTLIASLFFLLIFVDSIGIFQGFGAWALSVSGACVVIAFLYETGILK